MFLFWGHRRWITILANTTFFLGAISIQFQWIHLFDLKFIHCLRNVLRQTMEIIFMGQNPVLPRHNEQWKYTVTQMTLIIIWGSNFIQTMRSTAISEQPTFISVQKAHFNWSKHFETQQTGLGNFIGFILFSRSDFLELEVECKELMLSQYALTFSVSCFQN